MPKTENRKPKTSTPTPPKVVNLRGREHWTPGQLMRVKQICRPSIWGNRYVIPGQVREADPRLADGTLELVADREAAVLAYLGDFVWRRDLLLRLPELSGRLLGCWCDPEPCHGDVLVEWWHAWQDGAVCRVCGCTEVSACETDAGPCGWTELGLCSACDELLPEQQPLQREILRARRQAWEAQGFVPGGMS